MSLPKLPCEYKSLQRSRWNQCFGDLSEEDQLKLMGQISKISKIVKV